MTWFNNWFGRRGTMGPTARRVHSCRPRLEPLEARDTPGTFAITGSSPSPDPAFVQATVGQPYPFTVTVTDTDPGATTVTAFFGADGDLGAVSSGTRLTANIVGGTATIAWVPTFTQVLSSQGAALGDVSVGLMDNGTPPGVFQSLFWNVEVLPAPQQPPPSAPAALPVHDVTAQVQVSQLTRKFNATTGQTTLSLMLVNGGGAPIQGPFYLELGGLKHSIHLRNRAGLGAAHLPGSPYAVVNVNQLAPGQGTVITLSFSNSAGQPVKLSSFHPAVLAGIGQV